jgi:hypothetical protein
MKKRAEMILLILSIVLLLTASPAFADDWSLVSSRLIDFKPAGSAFDGSNNFNAIFAAKLIDGKILRPGEVFSFNQILGPRTVERGYAVGQNSNGDPDVGGGICREATVVYQAARDAGLNIIERNTHTPYVKYALPGEDAAVQYGLYDMRFANSSAVPVMIRTRGDMDNATLKLWAVLFRQESPRKVKITVSGVTCKEFEGSLINGKTFVPVSKITEIYGQKFTMKETHGMMNINAGGVVFSEDKGDVIRGDRGFSITVRKLVDTFGGAVSWIPGDVPLIALDTNKTY